MTSDFDNTPYRGLLVVGDPHLEGRVPGYRKDDYPRVILEKVRWCLNYAAREALLPAILGDLFHLPRDNPNWLLGELMLVLEGEILGIYGNHDVHENALTDDDSINIIAKAGRLTLLDSARCWRGCINGRRVVVGGTSWGQRLPESCNQNETALQRPLVIWLSHHDIIVPGYEDQGRIRPRELTGIDLVINGHIHRRLNPVTKGHTTWMTPGNIARRSRSDATKDHVPAALRIDIAEDTWGHQYITVPHKPAVDVFHAEVVDHVKTTAGSEFVAGLAELQARRTETGDSLHDFLERNLDQFDHRVANAIRQLAKEVVQDG